jgi:CDGSH-type Zn-finger protein
VTAAANQRVSGMESAEPMPQRTDVEIVPYRDGPYLVRGPVVVRDQEGAVVPVTRRPVALCRCGKSQMRPFCDGTHQLIGFQAPSEPERPFPTAAPETPCARTTAAEGQAPVRHAAGLVERALDALGRAADDGEDGAHLRAAMASLRTAARELGHGL